MKLFTLLLMIALLGSVGYAQQGDSEKKKSEQPKGKLVESLNLDSLSLKIQHPEPSMQEEIQVEAEDYPGLNVSIGTPAASLGIYKPYTRQELQAYSDLITDYALTSYNTTGTARPHKPGKIFQVDVPD